MSLGLGDVRRWGSEETSVWSEEDAGSWIGCGGGFGASEGGGMVRDAMIEQEGNWWAKDSGTAAK